MNTFFSFLPKDEKQRILNLELFDEYEEWHLKCSHYFILCAFNGQCNLLLTQILPCGIVNEVSLHPVYGSCELVLDTLCPKGCAFKRFSNNMTCGIFNEFALIVSTHVYYL